MTVVSMTGGTLRSLDDFYPLLLSGLFGSPYGIAAGVALCRLTRVSAEKAEQGAAANP